MLCCIHKHAHGRGGCSNDACQWIERNSWCPVVHMTYPTKQSDTLSTIVPCEAKTWEMSKTPSDDAAQWHIAMQPPIGPPLLLSNNKVDSQFPSEQDNFCLDTMPLTKTLPPPPIEKIKSNSLPLVGFSPPPPPPPEKSCYNSTHATMPPPLPSPETGGSHLESLGAYPPPPPPPLPPSSPQMLQQISPPMPSLQACLNEDNKDVEARLQAALQNPFTSKPCPFDTNSCRWRQRRCRRSVSQHQRVPPSSRSRVGSYRRDGTRIPLSDQMFLGTMVTEMRGYGWIKPDHPIDHPDAEKHQGQIFVSSRDAKDGLELGMRVMFTLYYDKNGLGAADCQIAASGTDAREFENEVGARANL